MGDYYDRAGNAMTLEEWATRLEDTEYKIVEKTEIGDAEVSTIWLGMSHNFGSGPPLIFETLIFGGNHDQDMWRYTTEEQAKAGHERVVEALRAGRDPNEGDE